MVTGWPAEPDRWSLEDRLEAHNNILLETRTSNFRENCDHESTYDEIRAGVRETDMSEERMQADLVLGDYDPGLEFGYSPVGANEWSEDEADGWSEKDDDLQGKPWDGYDLYDSQV